MLDVCIRFKLGLLNRDAIGHWGNYCRRRKYLRMKQQLLKGMLSIVYLENVHPVRGLFHSCSGKLVTN